jgi:hypothetical protein
LPATAPTSVKRFHRKNTAMPVAMNQAAALDSRVTDIAVDSSITRCAVATRRRGSPEVVRA